MYELPLDNKRASAILGFFVTGIFCCIAARAAARIQALISTRFTSATDRGALSGLQFAFTERPLLGKGKLCLNVRDGREPAIATRPTEVDLSHSRSLT